MNFNPPTGKGKITFKSGFKGGKIIGELKASAASESRLPEKEKAAPLALGGSTTGFIPTTSLIGE